MNSDPNHKSLPPSAGQSVSKESISKATSELNNLLQIISGTSAEIKNLWEGDEASEKYLEVLRSSIERAEQVASQLSETAGGTGERMVMHPELAAFIKPKNVARLPVSKPCVLVVDDEQMALELLKKMLSEAGYQVVTAQSGFECLDIFRRRPNSFQLVLLDLTMPFMDGEETFHRLRQIRPDVPVVLCTGFIQRERLNQLMESGLTGFLRKPLAAEEIVDTVRAIMASLKYSCASESKHDGAPLAG